MKVPLFWANNFGDKTLKPIVSISLHKNALFVLQTIEQKMVEL
jgi:hypothetical protein